MKRILTLLAFVALTITANAYVIQSGSCGDNVTFVLNDDGTLVISGRWNMENYSYSSYAPWFDNRSKIIKVQIEDGVTSIGNGAFEFCSRLTSVIIPNSVTSIGKDAFYNCSGLTSVVIPNSVTSIGSDAFYNCSSLTSVVIPNSVTSIGNDAFSGCSGLTSVTIPNSVTSIEDWAFRGCSGLTSIMVEKGNPNYDCRDNCNAIIKTSTNTLISGCKNTVIPNSVTSIGDCAFWDCSGLTSITIPNSVTSIGDGAFEYCSGLTSVTIPNSVTSIGGDAFAGCSSLPVIDNLRYADTYLVEAVDINCNSVNFKEGTRFIGDYAFSDCSGLTSTTIPNSVTSIGEWAFSGCSKLKEIHSQAITPPNAYTSYTFSGVSKSNCKLYVPVGTKEAYASAEVWREFQNIIEEESTAISLSDISGKYGDVEFYTLNGVKVDVPNKSGIYIVKKNGETKMVVVKK